jgi:hypothetical protein
MTLHAGKQCLPKLLVLIFDVKGRFESRMVIVGGIVNQIVGLQTEMKKAAVSTMVFSSFINLVTLSVILRARDHQP